MILKKKYYICKTKVWKPITFLSNPFHLVSSRPHLKGVFLFRAMKQTYYTPKAIEQYIWNQLWDSNIAYPEFEEI